MLAIRCGCQLAMQSFTPVILERVVQDVTSKSLTAKQVEIENRSGDQQINVSDLAIFICKGTDLESKVFAEVSKRELLFPVKIDVSIRSSEGVPEQLDGLISHQAIEANVSELQLQLSSKDMTLLKKTLDVILAEKEATEKEMKNYQEHQLLLEQ